MIDGLESKHLRVDWNDQVCLGETRLGFVDNDPEWPARFGPEPAWFAEEVAWLLEEWRDAQGNSYRPDAEAAFRDAVGDLR